MKHKNLVLSALFACSMMFCGGCEIFREALNESYSSDAPDSEDFNVRFNIGIFQIVKYPRAAMLEKEIDTPDGSICINTNALFSSKRIRQARAIPRPGNPDLYDLEFRLDRMGKNQWMMLHGTSRGEELVLMVDNRYVGVFVPENLEHGSQDWIHVRIGVDNYTARGIVKYAKKNYEFYNPEAKNWFNNLF